MAWTDSRVFTQYIIDKLKNTTALDLDDAATNVALFDTSVTPDQDATAANTAYGAGVWAAGGLGDNPSWPAIGRPLVSPTVTIATAPNVLMFDADNTVSADATTNITAAFGCLIYNDTIAAPVADQGIAYIYFGGTQTVTNGTLTIIWAASPAGIFALTL